MVKRYYGGVMSKTPLAPSTYITATATNQGVYYGTYAWL